MTNAPCSGPLPTRGCPPGCLSHAGVDAEPARPRCLPPSIPLGERGRGLRPQLPPTPPARAASSLFGRKKPPEAKRGCGKTFPGQFLPSFQLPPGPCWDGQGRERDGSWGGGRGAGREGVCCPQPSVRATGAFGASGCSALLGGGRTWSRSWAISRQTLWGGCQGVSSSGR